MLIVENEGKVSLSTKILVSLQRLLPTPPTNTLPLRQQAHGAHPRSLSGEKRTPRILTIAMSMVKESVV